MCLIVFAWRPGHALPLVVAANRDEFHARPTRALGPWADAPGVVAGRDLQAGGTWLGVAAGGRFAALTNIRAPGQPAGGRSRGELAEHFLRDGAREPGAYLAEVAGRVDQYAGFNLLVGDAASLWYLHSGAGVPERLAPGVYGLSNATLDTPWPKLVRAREALSRCLDVPGTPDAAALMALLGDARPAADAELPETGVPYEWEKRLSSVFIASPDYGTRASTVLLRRADGSGEITERRFGPDGLLGETRLALPLHERPEGCEPR